MAMLDSPDQVKYYEILSMFIILKLIIFNYMGSLQNWHVAEKHRIIENQNFPNLEKRISSTLSDQGFKGTFVNWKLSSLHKGSLEIKGPDRLCKVVELSTQCCENVSTAKVGVLNVEFALELRIYRPLKSFICLKWILKKLSTTLHIQFNYLT